MILLAEDLLLYIEATHPLCHYSQLSPHKVATKASDLLDINHTQSPQILALFGNYLLQ